MCHCDWIIKLDFQIPDLPKFDFGDGVGKKRKSEGGRWGDDLIAKKTGVRFPALTQPLTTICNSSPRKSDAFF